MMMTMTMMRGNLTLQKTNGEGMKRTEGKKKVKPRHGWICMDRCMDGGKKGVKRDYW